MGVGQRRPTPLQIDEVEDAFVALLLREGVSLEALPFLDVWRCFTRFLEVPVATPGDGVLYEWYVSDRPPEVFSVSFLRQLEVVDAHGDWFAYEQLSCRWTFPLTEALTGLPSEWLPEGGWPTPAEGRSTHLWWFPHFGTPLPTWIERVERRPELAIVPSLVPLSTTFGQDRL